MAELLIELLSEEIPARMQARAAQDLRRLVCDGLAENGLSCESAGAFVTPRRLALTVTGLPAQSPPRREERKGPRADAPQKAIEGFLRATGLKREDLEQRESPRGPVLFALIEHPGRPAEEIIAEVLEKVIRGFPWPKSMRWGTGSLRWVRPLHSILCLLSDEASARTVPLQIEDLTAGDTTRGHRFMAPEPFAVRSFEDYAARLKRAFVLLDPAERADRIWHEATNQAFACAMEVVEDRPLLAEVAGLVEWPVVLLGRIDEEFLDLPPEVLQTSMREHQKFLSLRNPDTGRIEGFVTVANRETADHGKTILAGNAKVLSARLADARFFWENDLRVAREGLDRWLERLEHVTFHGKLGSQGARIRRIAALAADLAPACKAEPDEAREAARLAKADLASEMVYEFPELQGVMGRYYLEAAGKSPAIAAAAQEHYAPLGPTGSVPEAPVSMAVALADKLDMLCGFWAIGEKPTGSKDPFALRRAALGVIRLVLENRLRLKLDRFIDAQLLRYEIDLNGKDSPQRDALEELLEEIARHGVFATAWHALRERFDGPLREDVDKLPDVSADLLGFIHERLKVHLRESGIRHDVIDACIAMPDNDDLTLLVARARALAEFLETEAGENLLQGFRRANNILEQAEARDGVEYSFGADPKYARAPEEKALFDALSAQQGAISEAIANEDFAAAMQALAALRGPIDAFFEAVQVNDRSDVVRRNRLNLLSTIRGLCLQVADLRRIEG